jgi:hypothetical protein
MLELNRRAEMTAPLLLLAEPSILTQSPDDLLRPIALQGGAIWLPERAAQMREPAETQVVVAAMSVLLNNQLHLPRPRARSG